MPPPSCTGISSPITLDDLADRELVLRHAGDRAVEVDEVQPLRRPARASAAPSPPGSSENTVAECMSPCFRRTQWPSLMSIAGMICMAAGDGVR